MRGPLTRQISVRQAVAWLCIAMAGTWATFSVTWPTPAVAQDEAASTETEAAPQEATTEATEPTEAEPAAEEQSALAWLIETSGWIGAIILGISFYFVYVVVYSFLTFKLEEACPPELVAAFEDSLKKRDLNTAYKLTKADESILGNALRAGMQTLPYGLSNAREAMDRQGETNVVQMDRQISMLAVIGSLGPMIGLLGTLKGMISSFSVIARSGTQLKPAEVAGGISEALVLTFEGVALSVPAIYFFAFFKNKISHISSETMSTADDFLLRAHNIHQQLSRASGAPQTADPGHV